MSAANIAATNHPPARLPPTRNARRSAYPSQLALRDSRTPACVKPSPTTRTPPAAKHSRRRESRHHPPFEVLPEGALERSAWSGETTLSRLVGALIAFILQIERPSPISARLPLIPRLRSDPYAMFCGSPLMEGSLCSRASTLLAVLPCLGCPNNACHSNARDPLCSLCFRASALLAVLRILGCPNPQRALPYPPYVPQRAIQRVLLSVVLIWRCCRSTSSRCFQWRPATSTYS
jgi:hypothetical protein